MSDRSSQHRQGGWFWPAFAGAVCGGMVLLGAWVIRDREIARNFLRGLVGFFTTPFILETSLVLLGFSLVVLLNHWRRKKDGDGWVYLAEDDPRTRDGQEPGRHDAVFANPPADEPAELEIEVIEGLLDLGSWDEAGQRLLALPEADYESPRALCARARLAEGLGRSGQAADLRKRAEEGSRDQDHGSR